MFGGMDSVVRTYAMALCQGVDPHATKARIASLIAAERLR